MNGSVQSSLYWCHGYSASIRLGDYRNITIYLKRTLITYQY